MDLREPNDEIINSHAEMTFRNMVGVSRKPVTPNRFLSIVDALSRDGWMGTVTSAGDQLTPELLKEAFVTTAIEVFSRISQSDAKNNIEGVTSVIDEIARNNGISRNLGIRDAVVSVIFQARFFSTEEDPFYQNPITAFPLDERTRQVTAELPTIDKVSSELEKVNSYSSLVRLINDWKNAGWEGIEGSNRIYSPDEIIENVSVLIRELVPVDFSKRVKSDPDFIYDLPQLRTITRSCGLRNAAARIVASEVFTRAGMYKPDSDS